jgi:hypothetical protein
MPSLRSDFSRRAARWLVPAALLALAPKCVVCVAAYAGFGMALGLGGPEFCGVDTGSEAAWVSSLAWLGFASGLGALGFFANCRRGDGKSSEPSYTR